MSERPFEDVAGVPTGPLDASAWETRWAEQNTPWDLNAPAPALVHALETGGLAPPGRAVVPGCGRGHDVCALANAGFTALGLDVSPTALAHARRLAAAEAPNALFVQADLFDLPPFVAHVDLVFEHTCFCAIDPGERDRYVDAVAGILRPGGRLFGVFFDIRCESGPPFGTTADEIRHRFGRRFDVERLETSSHSVPGRAGNELVASMRRSS